MSANYQLVLYVRLDHLYVTVECQLVPGLRGRPLVIGRERVEDCSAEARQLGLRVGMKLPRARRSQRDLVVTGGHADVYACKAAEAWAVCRRYTEALETYAWEAYGGAAGMQYVHGPPLALGRQLQREIQEATGLMATIGLGRNRLLAWIAAATAPAQQVGLIRPYEEARVLRTFPLARLPGLGDNTRQRLREMNLQVLHDLHGFSRDQLRALCQADGDLLYERCRGLDRQTIDAADRPVQVEQAAPLDAPTREVKVLHQQLYRAIEKTTRRLREQGLRAQRLELTITYDDGKNVRRRQKLTTPTHCEQEVFRLAELQVERLIQRRVAVRRLHVVLDQLTEGAGEPALFGGSTLEARNMYKTIDRIRQRYGDEGLLKLDV